MMLGFERRVATRFLREGRMQTILIIVGVAAGVAVVAYISALITGLQRNTLETAKYPTADFVITQITGLPAKLPTSGALSFTLVGDLTLKGVTKPTTWTVTATATPTGMTGTATTKFTFSEFGIAVPRVPVVARVDDPIQLQLDFNFVKQ